MLVISSYKKGDTICVKVSTGEEIVGRFESQDGDIQVIKPCVITLNPQNGQAMLIPWLMSIDTTSSDPITIKKEHILTTNKPNKSLADAYLQSTTGIAPASANTNFQL
jgi:hypothetical protein|tara:strand:- start:108 stop:431 length:324 start_codon:yes stop_codon:yes gene_type:complete